MNARLRGLSGWCLAVCFLWQGGTRLMGADWSIPDDLEAYFRAEVQKIEARTQRILRADSAEDWKRRQLELRPQLADMLGLDPMPSRSPLQPVVTKRVEKEDYRVENLHFQSSPGLYVTANLYLPKEIQEAVPAILYVCGHAHAKEGGISFGNKTAYQHHGIWFARHGMACLMIDTIQLGEIEGIHHGTYRHDRWWWNARGYTPAGVEAWNGIRALDYLQSRPEVNADRLGITGRSGGGVYSWWVAALDERVKAVVPVAGITDLGNYVLDGAVEGHCDCMFMVNRHRWDYPLVAALIAPRPLLIANSDKDLIFPLDGVVRTHQQVREIYRLLGDSDHLGLLITEGPHRDTQDLQVPAFRWFQRWLQSSDALIERAATKEIPPADLRVFDTLTDDEIVTSVDEVFVPTADPFTVPDSITEWDRRIDQLKASLRQEVFAGWPRGEAPRRRPLLPGSQQLFLSQANVELPLDMTLARGKSLRNIAGRHLRLRYLDQAQPEAPRRVRPEDIPTPLEATLLTRDVSYGFQELPKSKQIQIRRRYMMVGQTLDGMRVYDLMQVIQALLEGETIRNISLTIEAEGALAVDALYAGLMLDLEETDRSRLRFRLTRLPASHMEGPDFLNVMKLTRLDESLAALSRRYEVTLEDCPESLTHTAKALKRQLGPVACRLHW